MKKKYYILVGLITCMFMFLSVSEVRAKTTLVKGGKVTLCSYSGEYKELVLSQYHEVNILYDPQSEKFYVNYKDEKGTNEDETISFYHEDVAISGPASKSLFDNGDCPKRAFFYRIGGDHICFDDSGNLDSDKGYCIEEAEFNFRYYMGLDYSAFADAYNDVENLLYEDIIDYYKSFEKYLILPNFTDSTALSYKGRELCNTWGNKEQATQMKLNDYMGATVQLRYKQKISELPLSSTTRVSEMNSFVKKVDEFDTLDIDEQKTVINRISKNLNISEDEVKKILHYDDRFFEGCIDHIDSLTHISDEEKEEMLENVKEGNEINWDEINRIANEFLVQNPDSYASNNHCGGIFGDKTFGILQDLFGIIKMIIPAIVILLGMADFLKVVFSGEEKDMKLAGMRLVKRIIIGIILILLPVLLGFIFDLVGFSQGCLAELL